MGFKDVIALFTDKRGCEERLKAAIGLASGEGAHLVGLYLLPSTTAYPGGVPFAGSRSEIEALDLIASQARNAALATAGETEAAFREAAGRAGLSAEWRLAESEIGRADGAQTAALHVRHADIAVLGQDDPDHPSGGPPYLIESVLLGAGRPVLMVPYAGHFDRIGRNVLVAWNATREAARAVNDALPLLTRAEKVLVLSVNPAEADSGGPPWPGADISLHLARHGVSAEASSTVSHEIDVGNLILSRAADFGSDLIVMGGYGHSRQRELILGGVTRTLLQHMTVPVFLSH